MKGAARSISEMMASLWLLFTKEVACQGESPDEILRLMVKPEGEMLMPHFVDFILREMKGPKPGRSTTQQIADWKKLYKKFFHYDLDITNIQIPTRPEGFDRLIIVAKGFTLDQIYKVMSRHFDCWRFQDKKDLDTLVVHNDRDANKTGTYAIWLRDRQEADEENQNLPAQHFWNNKIPGITLAERMLFELIFWDETGEHLDMKSLTICSGSRDSRDRAIYMCFDSDGRTVPFVHCIDSDDADPYWRARSVVFQSADHAMAV